MNIPTQIENLKRRIRQRKAERRSAKDLESRLVLLVVKQIRREIRADRKAA